MLSLKEGPFFQKAESLQLCQATDIELKVEKYSNRTQQCSVWVNVSELARACVHESVCVIT